MSKKIFDDPTQQLFKPRGRILFFKYFMLLFFIILGVRFWFLQVVQHDHYLRAAENNRIRDIPIPAPRGTILDREGRILVDSRPTYTLKLYQEDMQNREETLKVLARFDVEAETVIKQMNIPGSRSRPVPVKINATVADRAWVVAHHYEHPELKIEVDPQRVYPLGEVLAHALGYTGQITEDQLREPIYNYCHPGDVIGQAGLEQTYDKILRGAEGSRRVLVDSRGEIIEELESIPAIPGRDLVTTIDLDIQKVAEAQLTESGFLGTVVINDPQDGGILAMASHPSYDPNLFAKGISPSEFNKLATDAKKPLRNRAIQDRYPPGSTWKIILGIAALEDGIIKDTDHLTCGGGISVGGRFAHCHGSHGAPDIRQAIAISCDGYFYRLGLKLGIDNLEEWEKKIGVGSRVGIDLPHENKGIVPSREWKRKEYPTDPRWKDTDMVYASIGQSGVSTTPLQIMYSVVGIGSFGKLYAPHLFREARAIETSSAIVYEPKLNDLNLSPANWKVMSEGMERVVTAGTSKLAKIPGFDVCGKSGTAQVVGVQSGASGDEKEHAWFVGYGPRDNPEIGGVVLLEHAGHGGVHCAPILRDCFLEYLRKKELRQEKEKEQLLAQAGSPEATTDQASSNSNDVSVKDVASKPNGVTKSANEVSQPLDVAKPTTKKSKAGESRPKLAAQVSGKPVIAPTKPLTSKPVAKESVKATKPTTTKPTGNRPTSTKPKSTSTKPKPIGKPAAVKREQTALNQEIGR